MTISNWADVYSERARQFTDPLDICEFYSGGAHYGEAWFEATTRQIIAALDLGPSDRVLEIGCGCGVLLRRLGQFSRELTGVDLSAEVLDVARREVPLAKFIHAPAAELPFADRSFDKCFAFQVMHYMDDLAMARRAIDEMRRVVRPGGRILLGQIPNAELEAEYQIVRRQRKVQRDERVAHQLRWLWFAPSFFESLRDQFAAITLEQPKLPDDPAACFRFDVVLIVA